MPTFRRALVSLALAAALLAPSAAAMGHRTAASSLQPGVAGQLTGSTRGWLGLLWSTLTSAWGKSGCTIDPNGVTVCSQGKNGCTIDPSGRRICQPESRPTSVAGDNGCTLDPDGRCSSGK